MHTVTRREREIASVSALAVALMVCGCADNRSLAAIPPSSGPNILLVSLDALRADRLGCYGHERATSPFLDRLAGEGVLFTRAFANTHGTPPSHTTMLSSQYQESHGVGTPVLRPEPRNDHLPADLPLVQELLRDAGYATIGVTGDGYMSRTFGFDRGFDVFWDQGGGVEPETAELVDILRHQWDRKRPAFVFYHTYEIHSPYLPPKPYKEMFGPVQISVAPTNEELLPIQETAADHLTDADFDGLLRLYDAGIRYTDDRLEAFVSRLDRLGFLDNAVVIVTSDHGEEFGDHGGLLHPATLYEELIHVPLILAGEGVPRGLVDDRLVGLIDIAPTILDVAGVSIPPSMQGQSLLQPELVGREPDAIVFSQYAEFKYSARTERWKLIETHRWPQVELYDLVADPDERKDLAEAHPDIVAELRDRLQQWRQSLPPRSALAAPTPDVDPEQAERLRALGYVE